MASVRSPISCSKFAKNCSLWSGVWFKNTTGANKITFSVYFWIYSDVVLSDMAADTTGNKSLDSIRTNQLCAEVINFSSTILKKKGVMVSKVFMGEDFLEVKNLAKSLFKNVNFFKPESSRSESKETYLYCEFLKTL